MIRESQQGKYQRSGVMWSSEELSRRRPGMYKRTQTSVSNVSQSVNVDLLPNTTHEPRFPRKIGIETARKWMNKLGFSVMVKKKGPLLMGTNGMMLWRIARRSCEEWLPWGSSTETMPQRMKHKMPCLLIRKRLNLMCWRKKYITTKRPVHIPGMMISPLFGHCQGQL